MESVFMQNVKRIVADSANKKDAAKAVAKRYNIEVGGAMAAINMIKEPIGSSWEEYEKHMLETGQWITANDMMMMYEADEIANAYRYEDIADYESATHGY